MLVHIDTGVSNSVVLLQTTEDSINSFLDSLGWLPLSLLLSKVMIISIPLELENLGADDI